MRSHRNVFCLNSICLKDQWLKILLSAISSWKSGYLDRQCNCVCWLKNYETYLNHVIKLHPYLNYVIHIFYTSMELIHLVGWFLGRRENNKNILWFEFKIQKFKIFIKRKCMKTFHQNFAEAKGMFVVFFVNNDSYCSFLGDWWNFFFMILQMNGIPFPKYSECDDWLKTQSEMTKAYETLL